MIFLVPDPPLNLMLDPDFPRSETAVSFYWEKATFNGGRGVIDYRVWYDNGIADEDFVILATGVDSTTFTTVAPLSPGLTYGFKV